MSEQGSFRLALWVSRVVVLFSLGGIEMKSCTLMMIARLMLRSGGFCSYVLP